MSGNITKVPTEWRNFSTMVPIPAFHMRRGDLKRLYKIINDKQLEYRDRIIDGLSQTPKETSDEFEARKVKVFNSFVTSVSITGVGGEVIHGNNESFLESINIPDQIKGVFISTKSVPQAVLGVQPLCAIIVNLDFTRFPLLDFTRMPTLATPNASNFEISADDESWFTTANTKLSQFFSERKTHTNWLHGAAIYDILLIFIGVPIGIWASYRLGGAIEKNMEKTFDVAPIISSAVYIYAFRNCPGSRAGSRAAQGFREIFGIGGQGVDDFPALFFGGREEGADRGEVARTLE
jgi:hypothetical protein